MSVKGGATYDDLVKVPDDKVAEIVQGELYASPRPRIRHARVGAALTAALFGAFDRGMNAPGGWWILYEPELHLGDEILVPDLAGWRRENLPVLPDAPAFELAPDWVCEILSPSTFELDRKRKLPAYAWHHVTWLWLIDPSERLLEVFRRENDTWTIIESCRANDRIQAEPFDAVEIDLSPFWY